MDLGKTLELIEGTIREVPNLRKLRYDDGRYELWYYEVIDILNLGFGPDSDEYKRFVESWQPAKRAGTTFELQKWYGHKLTKRAAALLSILKKYELLGEEPIRSEEVKPQKSSVTHEAKIPKEKIEQLKQFLRELEKFRRLQIAAGDSRQDPELDRLRTKLIRKSAQIKKLILPDAGQLIFTQFKEDFDAFDTAFTKPIFPWGLASQWHAAVNFLIQKTNETIGELETAPTSEVLREGVYPSGAPYDAYKDIKDAIILAAKRLIIVDPYVDGSVVTLLENVQVGVKIQVLTRKMEGDFQLASQKFKEQREKAEQGTLEVRKSGKLHDRFVVADDNFFHLGASIKDAGMKMCAMGEFEGSDIKGRLNEIISDYWAEAEIVL